MTRRQKDVLVALCQMTAEKGYPPAVRDLATRCGLSHHAGTVMHHLHNLERQGLVLGPSSEGCVRQYRPRPDLLVLGAEPYRIVAQMRPQEPLEPAKVAVAEIARNSRQTKPGRGVEGLAS